MPTIIDAEPSHIAELLAKPLSKSNAAGWSITGTPPTAENLTALLHLSGSYRRAVLNEKEECICLFGATSMPPTHIEAGRWGSLWLLLSEEAVGQLHGFADRWPEEIDTAHEQFGSLVAFVHVPDIASADWLEELGFKEIKKFSFTDRSLPIRTFVKEELPCASHQ